MTEKEQRDYGEETAFCVINLAYYYIFGASLLVERFARTFESAGLDAHGKAAMMLNRAAKNIKDTIKILDVFDENFRKASLGSVQKYDDFFSVSNELIANNLLYIGHTYNSTSASAKILEMMKSFGEPNPVLDELAEGYLKKAVIK